MAKKERSLVLTEAQVLRMITVARDAASKSMAFEEIVGQQMMIAISHHLDLPCLRPSRADDRYFCEVSEGGLEDGLEDCDGHTGDGWYKN